MVGKLLIVYRDGEFIRYFSSNGRSKSTEHIDLETF